MHQIQEQLNSMLGHTKMEQQCQHNQLLWFTVLSGKFQQYGWFKTFLHAIPRLVLLQTVCCNAELDIVKLQLEDGQQRT